MDEEKQFIGVGLDENINLESADNCQSSYLLDYNNIMNASSQHIWTEQYLNKHFGPHHITYIPHHFQDSISIRILQYTTNYEAIQIKVSYGHFEILFSIANVDTKCISSGNHQEYGGGFGSVCKIKINGFQYAIKKVKIHNDRFYEIFREVVKQYFLLAIASSLNIGPRVQDIFGFNIVIFKDFIAFSMEFCQGSNQYGTNINQQLRSKLRLLHQLQIVHMDIKPENITFSPSYEEHVFIDFGLSKMIKQTIGQQSLTHFSGSLNYCCNEMLECYNSNNLGFVDLYYNDAYCLKSTLNNLRCQMVEDNGMDQLAYFESLAKNVSKELLQTLTILKMKSNLFKIAIYSHCISYSRKALQYIQQFEESFANVRSFEIIRMEINKYISTLPQSINLLALQSRHKEMLISKYLQENHARSQHQQLFTSRFDESLISPQILSRFYQMKHTKIQKDQTYITQVSNELASQILFNQNKLQSIKLPVYKIILSNFIKVNSASLFAKKVEACCIFAKIYMAQHQQRSQHQMYYRTICYLWSSSLLESESFKVIKNLIGTIIILELKEEDELIGSFDVIFAMKCNFLQKISFVFELMQHIQLLRFKCKSKYNYERLIELLLPMFHSFLEEVPMDAIDQAELNIIKMLRRIIAQKINVDELANEKKNHFQVLLIKQRMHQNQLSELSDVIFTYWLALEIQVCLDVEARCPQNYIINLVLWLNKINRFSFTFTHVHLFLFEFYYQTGQISSCHIIYSQFIRRFYPFEEHKSFNIYLFNKYNKLKQLLSKNNRLGQRSPQQDQNQLELKQVCNQIFTITNNIVKNRSHFHSYVGQILKITNIQTNQALVDCIMRLYDDNSQKISKLSGKYHKNGPLLHRNTLRKEIGMMNNLYQFLFQYKDEKDKMGILQKQLLQYEKTIENNPCFKCRVIACFQIRLIYSNYLQFKKLTQQSLFCIADLLILSLKHKQLWQKKVSLLIHLMRLCWVRFDRIGRLYEPRMLFYELIKSQNRYHLLFIDIEEYNLFLNMYIEVAKMDPEGMEMADFTYNAAKSLETRHSVNSIDTFYYSILHLIKTVDPNNQSNFKLYHCAVLYYLLKREGLKKNPYISLYLLVLLQIRMNTEIQSLVFAFISFSVASMRSYPRNIILSRYYQLFTSKFSLPLRRFTSLNKKHLRYTVQKHSIRRIMTLKMSNEGLGRRNRPTIKLLIHKIGLYHHNLMNIE